MQRLANTGIPAVLENLFAKLGLSRPQVRRPALLAAGLWLLAAVLALALPVAAPPQLSSTLAAPEAATAPARRGLGLPAGAQVRRMAVGEGRLVLAVAVPGAGERIVIVDLRDGRMVAAIALEGAR